MSFDLNKLNEKQKKALNILTKPTTQRSTKSVLKLDESELRELISLGLIIKTQKKLREKADKFSLPSDSKMKDLIINHFKISAQTTTTRRRTPSERIDIDLLINRIGKKFKEIIRTESIKPTQSSYLSFFEFATKCNKYISRNMSFGKRIYFDKLYDNLRLSNKNIALFKIYIKDMSLIFPKKIRLNPKMDMWGNPKIIIEDGGTKYDSLIITESIF